MCDRDHAYVLLTTTPPPTVTNHPTYFHVFARETDHGNILHSLTQLELNSHISLSQLLWAKKKGNPFPFSIKYTLR